MRPHGARTALVLLVLLAAAGPASAAILTQSTFDADAEGWRAVIVPTNMLSTVTFVAGAGSPGGAIRHIAPSEGDTSYFLAPASFPTALHSAVGGSLDWEVSTISEPGDTFFGGATAVDVSIGAGVTRIRLIVTPPAPAAFPAYTSYQADFTTAEGGCSSMGPRRRPRPRRRSTPPCSTQTSSPSGPSTSRAPIRTPGSWTT